MGAMFDAANAVVTPEQKKKGASKVSISSSLLLWTRGTITYTASSRVTRLFCVHQVVYVQVVACAAVCSTDAEYGGRKG